ncbi:MAG: acyl-CoA/acyl-ACP dehydrogenase [Sphingomonadales bacterium]|nr:acyl-CoA/acyl-ACP dehydrogenase [Sphingomonadales bacterium]
MNFQFSEEAEALRDEARKFLAAESGREKARAVMNGDATHDAALWSRIAELGWTGLRIPEAHGGLGLSVLELCVLAEEVGRALSPVPFTSSVLMATELLMASGHDAAQAAWLPKLADGSAIGTVAWMEGDATRPDGTPKLSCSGDRLTGAKLPVADGLAADFAIVTARGEAGALVIALVDLSATGVSRSACDTVDLVRKSAKIVFSDAPCTVLARADEAERLRARHLQGTAVLLAFEGLGSADAAMEMAVDYAKERVAFGRRIGGYQAVKHRCADMYIKNQLARSHAYYGAWALLTGAPELALAAAGARVAAIDALQFAAEENVQLHGGIGFTWESDCQFFYRRGRLLALNLGSRTFWSDQLVRALEQRNTDLAA